MENILVLSDIHSGVRRAVEAVKMHPECKTVFFLGDGCRHVDALCNAAPDAAVVAVMGNNDTFLDGVSETELVLEIGSHRIFMCHGHTRMAKSGTGAMLRAAKAKDCDIVLYGHTHHTHEEYDSESGVYIFNPGSIGVPHDGRCTYGLLSLDKNSVLFSIGEVE